MNIGKVTDDGRAYWHHYGYSASAMKRYAKFATINLYFQPGPSHQNDTPEYAEVQKKNGPKVTLRWCHNERDSVSNHQPSDCLLNRLFRRRSKKTSKLRVTGLCAGNSPGTGEFPAQMASNAENVSIWWRHHEKVNDDVMTLNCFCHCGFPVKRASDAELWFCFFGVKIVELPWHMSLHRPGDFF